MSNIVGTWVLNETLSPIEGGLILTDVEGTFTGNGEASMYEPKLATMPIKRIQIGDTNAIYQWFVYNVADTTTYPQSYVFAGTTWRTAYRNDGSSAYAPTSYTDEELLQLRTITITKDPDNDVFFTWLSENAEYYLPPPCPDPMGKHSITSSTPTEILLGAGVFCRDLTNTDGTWSGQLMGATSGGGKVTIKGEYVDLDWDGVLVKTKKQTVKQGGVATMEVNYAEISPELLKTATLFNDNGEDKPHISEGDYVSNFGFVGYTADGSKRMVIIFESALCTSGLEVEGKNREQTVVKLVLEAVADDVTLLPVKIYHTDSVLGVWKFKDELTLTNFEADVEFSYHKESTGTTRNCVGIICIDGVLTYSSPEFNDGALEVYYNDVWRDTYYKTITIVKEPTDTAFIAWLKSNAERQ